MFVDTLDVYYMDNNTPSTSIMIESNSWYLQNGGQLLPESSVQVQSSLPVSRSEDEDISETQQQEKLYET